MGGVFGMMISFRIDSRRDRVHFKTYQALKGDPQILNQPELLNADNSITRQLVDILIDAEEKQALFYRRPRKDWMIINTIYDDQLDELCCYLHPLPPVDSSFSPLSRPDS